MELFNSNFTLNGVTLSICKRTLDAKEEEGGKKW